MIFKIASWNVNSLRVRLPQVLQWLDQEKPDVLALQETKVQDADFPRDVFLEAGYHACFSGQKTYNGVAILSRRPGQESTVDIPGMDDPQRRFAAVTVQGVRIVDLYVPNGQEVDSEKYRYKLNWLGQVTDYLRSESRRFARMVVLGDFNIAPDDRDVHDPDLWRDRILCSGPERQALRTLQESAGVQDVFRCFKQPEDSYSWWDYRQAGFRRNRGLRIDLVLATAQWPCTASRIDKAVRGWERPSDHAPVIAEFEIEECKQ